MIDWLAAHGAIVVMIVFMVIFCGFSFWAYRPSNKNKLKNYGQIPLMENEDGQ